MRTHLYTRTQQCTQRLLAAALRRGNDWQSLPLRPSHKRMDESTLFTRLSVEPQGRNQRRLVTLCPASRSSMISALRLQRTRHRNSRSRGSYNRALSMSRVSDTVALRVMLNAIFPSISGPRSRVPASRSWTGTMSSSLVSLHVAPTRCHPYTGEGIKFQRPPFYENVCSEIVTYRHTLQEIAC